MNMKTVTEIAGNPKKQWYFNQTELQIILGIGKTKFSDFIKSNPIPFYSIGKAKSYFLPDVLEAIEQTKWKLV